MKVRACGLCKVEHSGEASWCEACLSVANIKDAMVPPPAVGSIVLRLAPGIPPTPIAWTNVAAYRDNGGRASVTLTNGETFTCEESVSHIRLHALSGLGVKMRVSPSEVAARLDAIYGADWKRQVSDEESIRDLPLYDSGATGPTRHPVGHCDKDGICIICMPREVKKS